MRHRNIEYNVGNLVLLSRKNLLFKGVPTKLQRNFVGPFEVTKRIGTQAYKLSFLGSWKTHNVFHASLLKRWKTATYKRYEQGPVTELEPDDEPCYHVEKILRWRKTPKNRGKEYLVLRAGYPLAEAIWEAEKRLVDPEAFSESLKFDGPPEKKAND